MTTSNTDYILKAKESANNHAKFESFMWHDSPEDAENWCIVHTVNRDSGILEKSNAAVIAKSLKPYIRSGQVIEQHFNHWLCGWVDGYAIRVFHRNAKIITVAFKAWCDLNSELEECTVLDEDDYSRKQMEAAIESIENNTPTISDTAPKYWSKKVYSELCRTKPEAVEEVDSGIYVKDLDILDALIRIDPTWIDDPFDGDPPKAYEDIITHMSKASSDLAKYIALVPHAEESATLAVTKLRERLEVKRRKFIRDYFRKKE